MTCVSLRSGMASSGTWVMDHQPRSAAATTEMRTTARLLTEKSMTLLIMIAVTDAL